MKPKLSLLTIQTLQRDVTESNAGRMAVQLEYICRNDPWFCTWKGLCSKASEISYTPAGMRKGRLLDSMMIIESEIRKLTRQHRHR